MSLAPDRRGFLRGLATLPLVGGSVALIGDPTKAAIPATDEQLALYGAFMLRESQEVLKHFSSQGKSIMHLLSDAWGAHGHLFPPEATLTERAPIILSAAGVPLMGGLGHG